MHASALYHINLSGQVCPMAFVLTKIKLDQLQHGDQLEILFEDSKANKPLIQSIISLGHSIKQDTLSPKNLRRIIVDVNKNNVNPQ